MSWDYPLKPAEFAEQKLITAILDRSYPINSSLPPERELAGILGVTRPTLRETLQRLARDGWIEIRHGKPTRVRDYLKEGNLNILSTLSRYKQYLPEDFILSLLHIREILAPAYAFLAIQNDAAGILSFLQSPPALSDSADAFSEYDFSLHFQLTQLSGNPVFTLIFNGFHDLIIDQSRKYFENELARKYSLHFYRELLMAAINVNPKYAREITQEVMERSISYWQENPMRAKE